jgi:hypothetical protein
MVSKSGLDLQRRDRSGPPRNLAPSDFFHVPAKRFPGQWRNLGGERAAPYVCKIGDKWLEVRASLRVTGRGGKSFETITPDVMKSATAVRETNPTWKWTDQEPRSPAR